ncbi:sulfurtransferase complex subunit TusD [Oceanospirillum sp.]|uniref:sulfurtransferase complex subunit TusD n=1 Tax=Oceanospirillum sp. TaxID=2021254 RepID=UPI003A8EBFE0
MNYSIAIYGGPYSDQASLSALHFTRAVLKREHRVQRVFFYHDGVYNSSALVTPPQDEINVPIQWQTLASEHGIELVVCIAAAVRRGLLDEKEAKRYSKSSHNLADGYTLSGLGQLIDASINCDKLITFGA